MEQPLGGPDQRGNVILSERQATGQSCHSAAELLVEGLSDAAVDHHQPQTSGDWLIRSLASMGDDMTDDISLSLWVWGQICPTCSFHGQHHQEFV